MENGPGNPHPIMEYTRSTSMSLLVSFLGAAGLVSSPAVPANEYSI